MPLQTNPKCKIYGCTKITPYRLSKNPYCHMHMARIRRHGHSDLQSGYHKLEKLPHDVVDAYILENCKKMYDEEIVTNLRMMGFEDATTWNVKYRRRKLGVRKYLYGDVKKHKAWIRQQAIGAYGDACELCDYSLCIETHHIVPKYKGGPHAIENLTVLCPNCHALMTREIIQLTSRADIPVIRERIARLLHRP